MPKPVVRIPLDVSPEMADAIDRAVNLLGLETNQRQTRSSFIKNAIQGEIDRLEKKYGEAVKRSTMEAGKIARSSKSPGHV